MASSEPTTEAPKPMATKQTVSAPAESKTPPKVAEMVTQGMSILFFPRFFGEVGCFADRPLWCCCFDCAPRLLFVRSGQRKAIEGNLNGAANLFGEALGVM